MSELINSFSEEVTILNFEGKACVAKKREYDASVYDMVFC